jgi:hypothetical protein
MSPSTSGFNLASLQCGIDSCEPETLRFLSRAIGHTLVRLKLCIGDAMELSQSDASAFVCAFPVLEYLNLNHVSLGSMDVLLRAYENIKFEVPRFSPCVCSATRQSETQFLKGHGKGFVKGTGLLFGLIFMRLPCTFDMTLTVLVTLPVLSPISRTRRLLYFL